MANTYQNSQGQYFNTQAEAAASNTSLGTNPSTLNTSATSAVNQSNAPINASSLGTPTNTQVPPPVTTNTAQMNLGTQASAFTEGIAGNQAAANQEAAATAVVTPTNSRQGILDKISSLLGVQSTQGQVTSDIFNEEGVQAKKDLVRNLENEALAKDRAYTKQAEKIRMNSEGKLESGIQIDLNNLERQRNSELADIAIQSKIATGNYQSAFEIADAKVKAQFEPIENQIKGLTTLYGLYQDDLTESEKIQAQAKIQEKQSALDFARQKELVKYKASIDAAEMGVDPKVLATEQFKKAQAAQNLKNTLAKTIEAVNKYGNKEKLSAEGKGILDTLKVQLRSEISTALEQGVVVPGEAASFDAIAGELGKSFFIRNSKTLGSLNSLSSSMDSRISTQKAALLGTYGLTNDQVNTLLGVSGVQNDPLGLGLGGGSSNNNPLGI